MARRSRKEKVAGREKHRQFQRDKKVKRKLKKNSGLPRRHIKGKKLVFYILKGLSLFISQHSYEL